MTGEASEHRVHLGNGHSIRSIFSLGLLLALTASILTLTPTRAEAYPGVQISTCPQSDRYRYNFNDAGIPWAGYPNEQTYLRVTLGALNDELDYSTPPQPLADIAEDDGFPPPPGSTTSVDMFLLNDPSLPFVGVAPDCDLYINLFQVNAAVASGIPLPDVYGLVGRHEIGYVLGMSHGGEGDDIGTLPAMMATCTNPTGFVPGTPIQRDTSQYLNYVHNDKQHAQVTANGGFERGTKYFLSKDMSLSTSTVTAASGNRAARLTAQKFAYNSYIYQTATFWHGTNSPREFRNAFRIRERNVTDTTKFRTRLFAKRRNDGSTQTCGDPANGSAYLLGLVDPNVSIAQSPDNWVVVYTESLKTYNTDTWSINPYTSTFVNPDTFTGLILATGYEIQLRIYGRAITTSGQKTHFWIDEARMERN